MDVRKKKTSTNGGRRVHNDNGQAKAAKPVRKMSSSGQNKANAGFQRQPSCDNVRKIVQMEGRAARNLITWNVPVEDEKRPKSSSPHLSQRKTQHRSRSTADTKRHDGKKKSEGSPTKSDSEQKSTSRPSSQNSLGGKKPDLRARYWTFLFENLRRSVDEIYQTCEADESVLECKEVIMMMKHYTRDFESLIGRLEVIRAYENADKDHKPLSLAWEVRKSSPGKSFSSSAGAELFKPSPHVARSLNFGQHTWADRVKGLPISASESLVSKSCGGGDDGTSDGEGWETVQRKSIKSTKQQNPESRKKSRKSASSNHGNHGLSGRANSQTSVNSNGSEKENILKTNHSNNRTNVAKAALSNGHMDKICQDDKRGKTKDINAGRRRSYRDVAMSSENLAEKTSDVIKPEAVSEITPEVAPNLKSDVELSATKEDEHDLVLEEVTLTEDDIKEDVEVNVEEEKEDEEEDEDEISPRSSLDDKEEEELKAIEKLDQEDQKSEELEREREKKISQFEEEEANYLRELQKEESRELIIDDEDAAEQEQEKSSSSQPWDWETLVRQYDEAQSAGAAWGDMVELEEGDLRTPGHVVHMHEKLSSPSRKRSLNESKKRHEEKQAKASELREKLSVEKQERIRLLTSKVEEVRAYKDELLTERKVTMQEKLDRAEERRQLQLLNTVRKAHQEETKANEIAFINNLEAQNKKHDITMKYHDVAARKADIEKEKLRKHEEKKAKEAEVEERRKALEAERQAKLVKMQQKREEKVVLYQQRVLNRETERREAIMKKEKQRDERIAVINQQQQDKIDELQRKIQIKLEESERRKKENLGHIQEKAFRMTLLKHSTEDSTEAPGPEPYSTKKVCTACSVMITSEVYLLSHLRGKKHQAVMREQIGRDPDKVAIENFNLRHVTDAPADRADPQTQHDRERQRALRKRCKKLRQRMMQRGTEFETAFSNKGKIQDSERRVKLQKVLKDLNKYLSSDDKGPWTRPRVSAADRALGELTRQLEDRKLSDQLCFRDLGGLTTICRMLLLIEGAASNVPSVVPEKSLISACNVLRLACRRCYDNAHYILFSNKIGMLIDAMQKRLEVLLADESCLKESPLPYDPVLSSLMVAVATVLSTLSKYLPSTEAMSSGDAYNSRANDCVSYIICTGVVDGLALYLRSVHRPLNNDHNGADFIQHSLWLLTALTSLTSPRCVGERRNFEDTSGLVSTFKATHLFGIVSLMYGMLLQTGVCVRGETAPSEIPGSVLDLALAGVRLLNTLALLDLRTLQNALGEEGTSLEFRHIAAYLLWYTGHWSHEELLHELIVAIGYFTQQNVDNQAIIQSGQPPSVLQQLCCLPFHYFSSPKFMDVLFPSLISCCYKNKVNRDILEQELSCALLVNFLKEKLLQSKEDSLTPPVAKTKIDSSGKKKSTQEQSKIGRLALEQKVDFRARFPESDWQNAMDYFSEQNNA